MENPERPHQIAAPGPGRFGLGRFAIWLTICVVCAGLLAIWPAAQISRYFAPLVLFPLLEGVALGVICLFWLHYCNQGHRWSTLVGLVVTTVVFVIAQHYGSFRAAHAAALQHQEAIASKPSTGNGKQAFTAVAARLAPQPPDSMVQYLHEEAEQGRPLFGKVMARGVWAWVTWAVDGLLVFAAAMFIVMPALKQPYCNTCHHWYRVVRAAPLPGNCEDAILAACGRAEEEPVHAQRFAILSCPGGCGPDALDLFPASNERGPAPQHLRIWLSVPERQAVTAILDQSSARGGTES